MTKEKEKPMTEQKYVKCEGRYCPFCKSEHITGSSPDMSEYGVITIPTECEECQEEWTEYYNLSGYGAQEVQDDN